MNELTAFQSWSIGFGLATAAIWAGFSVRSFWAGFTSVLSPGRE